MSWLYISVLFLEHYACVVNAVYVVGFAISDGFFAFASRLHPCFFDFQVVQFLKDFFCDLGGHYEDDDIDFAIAAF